MRVEHHNAGAAFGTPENFRFDGVQRWINREIEAPNTARVRLRRRRAALGTRDRRSAPDILRCVADIPRRSRASSCFVNAHMRVLSANRRLSWKFSDRSG